MRPVEPGDSVDIVLDRDKGKENGRVFEMACPSLREQKELAVAYEQIFEAVNAEELFDRSHGFLSKYITGWRNVSKPYSADALWDVLNFAIAKELFSKVLECGRVSYDEKKE